MRIFNKTHIFYVFFSLLLLCLGVSCILISPNNKKSNAEWMYAEARIINLYSDIPLASDSTYLGQTIYSVSPTLSVSAGTTSGSWCTATATGSETTKTSEASATQWNSNEKGWVSYSFNETYYNIEVYVVGEGDGSEKGSTSFSATADGEKTYTWGNATEYYATMWVYPNAATANFYAYPNNNLYATYTTMGYSTVLYGLPMWGSSMDREYNSTPYLYSSDNIPTGQYFYGWRVGSTSGQIYAYDYSTPIRIYALTSNYYAYYLYETYNITFDETGGGAVSDMSVTYNSSCTLPTPTRTGYTFTGWASDSGTFSAGYYSKWTTDLGYNGGTYTFTATWTPNTYTITLNQNSATTGGTTSVSATYDTTTSFSITNPKRTGYIFKGWTSSQNGTTYVINTSGVLLTSVTGYTNSNGQWQRASATTLYAKWEIETYTLNFNAGDGTASMGSLSVSYGQSLTSSTDPRWPYATQAGHIFKGWIYGSTTYTSYTVPDITPNTEGTGSRTFTASWEDETYTINFNGGTSLRGAVGTPSVSSKTVTYGSTYTTSANTWPTATLTGYLFQGWKSGYDSNVYITWYTANIDYTPNTEGTTSVTFTAQWKPITFYVKFNGNNATTGSMENMTFTYDTAQALTDNAFARKNYLFLGWSTSSTATGATYINKQSVENLSTTNGATVNLYAVWRETYANKYATPSGSGSASDPYLISSASNLAWLSNYTENTGSLSGYFKQTANIDLSTYEWLPISSFLGNYDGNGYAISGLKINLIPSVNRYNLGLFGIVSGSGIVQNVRLIGNTTIGSNSGSSWQVGSIAGTLTGSAKILNCTNFNNVNSGNDYVGGIVGTVNGSATISGCQNYGNVTGNLWVGGIAGDVNTSGTVTIENCYVKANITAKSNYNSYGGCAGGIVGRTSSGTININACAFEGDILYGSSGSEIYQGAIVGNATGTVNISNCYADANMATVNNYGLYSGTATVTDCVFVINSTKRCKGTSFTNWLITSDNRPVPAGLTWLATGGTKVTSSSQITTLGYTLVS